MFSDVLAWLSPTGLAHRLQVASFTFLQQLGIMSGNARRYATRTISRVEEAQVYDGHNYGPQIPDADTLQVVVALLFLAVALLVTGLLVAGRYVYKRKIKSLLVPAQASVEELGAMSLMGSSAIGVDGSRISLKSLLQRVASALPPTAAHQSAVVRVKELSAANEALSRNLRIQHVNSAHVARLRATDQREINTLAARVCALEETNAGLSHTLGTRDEALEDMQLDKERIVEEHRQTVHELFTSLALVKLAESRGKTDLELAISGRSAAEKEAQEAWTMVEERSSELEALAEESRKLQRQAAEREQSLQRDISEAQDASRVLSDKVKDSENKSSAVNERLAEQRHVNDTLRAKLAAVESSLAEEKQAHAHACEAHDIELASLRTEVAGFKKAALIARSELNVRDNSIRQSQNAHAAELAALRRTHAHELNERDTSLRQLKDQHVVDLAALERAHTQECEPLRLELASFKKAALIARSDLNVLDNTVRQSENAHAAQLVSLRRTHVHELNERDTSLRQLKDKHAVDVAALERAHAQECEPLRVDLASYKNAAVIAKSELNARDNTIRQLVITHAADLVALRRTHGHECEQLRRNTLSAVSELKRKHADELVELRAMQHDKERVIEELGENVQAFAVSLAVAKLAESKGKAKLARAVSAAAGASVMVEERDRRLAAWADEWRKAQRKEIKNDKALQLALNRALYMSHTLEFRLEDAHHEANAVNERVVKQSKTIKVLRVKLAVAKSDLAKERRSHSSALEEHDAVLAALRSRFDTFKDRMLLTASELDNSNRSLRQLEDKHAAEVFALQIAHADKVAELEAKNKQLSYALKSASQSGPALRYTRRTGDGG